MASSYRKTPVLESLFLILSIEKFLRAHILKNLCLQLLLKMSSWNWVKSKFLRSFNFILKNRFLQHQYQKQVKMLVFTSWMVSHDVCIHIQYFFGVVRISSNTKYLELIKRRSKIQEKNMFCQHALYFDQWKTFSENYKSMRV